MPRFESQRAAPFDPDPGNTGRPDPDAMVTATHVTRAHSIAVALIVLVCVGAFATALRNGFVWDDKLIIVNNHGIRDLKQPLKFFAPGYWHVVRADPRAMPTRGYRPLPELLFALDYAVWGPKPAAYHAASIVVHTVTCVLVYVLAYRILAGTRAALFCALLFAAHPIHVEAVVWAKARPELLALLLVLTAVLLYDRYLHAPTPRRARFLHLGSAAVFGLALMCKASAVVVPALLALYVWCFASRRTLRPGLFGLLPFVGVGALFFAIDSTLPQIPRVVQATGIPGFLNALAALGMYLKLLVLPAELCVHHRICTVAGASDHLLLQALPLGLALLGGAFAALRRSRVALFALGWIIICLAPLADLQLLGRQVAELRAYQPSVGFCLLLGFLLAAMPALSSIPSVRASLQRASLALCVLLVCAYTGLSAARSLDWADAFTLWSDTIQKNPESWHALAGLAQIYMDNQLPEKAIPLLEHLAQLDPMDRSSRYQLAAAYYRTRRLDDAIAVYELLMAQDPADARARAGLGALCAEKGLYDKAMTYFRDALRIAPQSAYVHRQLGTFLFSRGRHAEALAEWQEVVRLEGDSPAARHTVGLTYAAMGRHTEAIAQYRKCLESDPAYVPAWMSMARSYEELGNVPEAVRCYGKCVEVGGELAQTARERLQDLAAGPQR